MTTERPTTIEYGVKLTVTSAFGVHCGTGHHTCRYWTPKPESGSEAKEMLADEHGVVEVHDVKAREVPAPEKWDEDDPRILADGGEAKEDTEQCINCGDTIDGDGVYNANGVKPDAADKITDGEGASVGEIVEFNDGPYCSIECSVRTGGDA